MSRSATANLLAMGAIALWGGLAWLGVRLSSMPPFLLVGTALGLAALLASPTWRLWRVPPRVLALGVYGLFGFHFFLFVALRLAPPLQANLVNYLWPLLIVLLAPLFLRDVRLSRWHVAGGFLGLSGAMLAITNGHMPDDGSAASPGDAAWGYAAALLSAFIWATYSLFGQRLRQNGTSFPTAAVGLFCLVSSALSLACHAALEASYTFSSSDLLPLAALAIGPMGAAFFLWDAAMQRGDPRVIGTLAYLTPLISTCLLGLDDPSRFGWPIAVALLLVIVGAVVGTRRPAAGPRVPA
jgi:drug/metabolite transporter (DMT)-like permease